MWFIIKYRWKKKRKSKTKQNNETTTKKKNGNDHSTPNKELKKENKTKKYIIKWKQWTVTDNLLTNSLSTKIITEKERKKKTKQISSISIYPIVQTHYRPLFCIKRILMTFLLTKLIVDNIKHTKHTQNGLMRDCANMRRNCFLEAEIINKTKCTKCFRLNQECKFGIHSLTGCDICLSWDI